MNVSIGFSIVVVAVVVLVIVVVVVVVVIVVEIVVTVAIAVVCLERYSGTKPNFVWVCARVVCCRLWSVGGGGGCGRRTFRFQVSSRVMTLNSKS